MKKNLVFMLFLLTLFTGLLYPAYAQDTVTLEAITFTDDLQREVTVPIPLTSVVTLAPSLTETLAFLGADDLITAVDINSDYPDSIAGLPRITGWDMSVNFEELAALDPDLILVSEMTSLEEISTMENLGLNVFCVKNPADFPELFETILMIGEIIGKTAEAEVLTAELSDRVAKTEAVTAEAEDKPLVFYEIDASDPSKPWTAGKGTFISKMIQMAGGINLGDELDGEWIQISLEALLKADPQIILLGDSMYGSDTEEAAKRTGWSEINAVRNTMIYEFDDNLVTRPGPRLVDGFEQIARLIHPELFSEKEK